MEEYDKTRLIRRPSNQPPPPPPPPPLPGGSPSTEEFEKTRILPRLESDAPAETAGTDEDKTVILTPPLRSQPQGEMTPNDPMIDPVVGWLVVVAGPGQGHTLRLGHGMNSIGRAESQRCQLDFGDTEISRNCHATLTYDPRGRKFYLMHGGGQNLTYLGDAPVLQPTLLAGGELISLGKTTLKFVPLCGEDFDWSQQTLPTP